MTIHIEVPDWVDDAICAQTDPEEWFPEKGGTSRHAKALCVTCPVRSECLTWALDMDERYGIWGGYSERDRRKLKADPAARAEAFAHIAATTPTAPTTLIPTRLHEDPAMTITTRCRWCSTLSTSLNDHGLCPDCTTAAAQAPVARQTIQSVGGVNATPATVNDSSGGDGTKDAQEAVHLSAAGDTCAPDEHHPLDGCPDYIIQIAVVMRDSEGHRDQAVRAARKAVVGTLQVLNKTLAAAATSDLDVLRAQGLSNADILDRELQAVEKRGPKRDAAVKSGTNGGHSGAKLVAARVTALGVTSRDIRAWATDAGIDVPSRGALPARVIDAYEAAHTAAAS